MSANPKLHAPTDSKERKGLPVCTGVLDYFPDAILAVAELSRKGNDKHNPGLPLQWSKHLSNDHADCILRHLIDRGTIDPEDNVRHSTKVAWRALALLQIEIEKERAEDERRALERETIAAACHLLDQTPRARCGVEGCFTPHGPEPRLERVHAIETNKPIPVVPRYDGQLDEDAHIRKVCREAREKLDALAGICSICGRPECGSVEPACVAGVWPSS